MKYLTADDIAAEIGVSRSRAYEIMKECQRLVTGRTIRVSRPAFEAWKRRHEEQPQCQIPSSRKKAHHAGGAASPTLVEVDISAFQQVTSTESQRSRSGEISVVSPSRVPIRPRIKAPLQTRSTDTSPDDEQSDEPPARSTA